MQALVWIERRADHVGNMRLGDLERLDPAAVRSQRSGGVSGPRPGGHDAPRPNGDQLRDSAGSVTELGSERLGPPR